MKYKITVYNVRQPEDRYVPYCEVSVTQTLPNGNRGSVAGFDVSCFGLALLLQLPNPIEHEFKEGDEFPITLTVG